MSSNSGDTGFVYYTSALDSPTHTTVEWLANLVTYRAPGTGCTPWKPSLDHAMAAANPSLARGGGANHPVLQANGWSIVT